MKTVFHLSVPKLKNTAYGSDEAVQQGNLGTNTVPLRLSASTTVNPRRSTITLNSSSSNFLLEEKIAHCSCQAEDLADVEKNLSII